MCTLSKSASTTFGGTTFTGFAGAAGLGGAGRCFAAKGCKSLANACDSRANLSNPMVNTLAPPFIDNVSWSPLRETNFAFSARPSALCQSCSTSKASGPSKSSGTAARISSNGEDVAGGALGAGAPSCLANACD